MVIDMIPGCFIKRISYMPKLKYLHITFYFMGRMYKISYSIDIGYISIIYDNPIPLGDPAVFSGYPMTEIHKSYGIQCSDKYSYLKDIRYVYKYMMYSEIINTAIYTGELYSFFEDILQDGGLIGLKNILPGFMDIFILIWKQTKSLIHARRI